MTQEEATAYLQFLSHVAGDALLMSFTKIDAKHYISMLRELSTGEFSLSVQEAADLILKWYSEADGLGQLTNRNIMELYSPPRAWVTLLYRELAVQSLLDKYDDRTAAAAKSDDTDDGDVIDMLHSLASALLEVHGGDELTWGQNRG